MKYSRKKQYRFKVFAADFIFFNFKTPPPSQCHNNHIYPTGTATTTTTTLRISFTAAPQRQLNKQPLHQTRHFSTSPHPICHTVSYMRITILLFGSAVQFLALHPGLLTWRCCKRLYQCVNKEPHMRLILTGVINRCRCQTVL